MLEDCFNFDHHLRPSAEDIYESDFFAGYTTVIKDRKVLYKKNDDKDSSQSVSKNSSQHDIYSNQSSVKKNLTPDDLFNNFVSDSGFDKSRTKEWHFNAFVSHAEVDESADYVVITETECRNEKCQLKF